jgi:uncharacterized protein (TIGR02266 family)
MHSPTEIANPSAPVQADPRRAHERTSLSLDVTVEGDHNFFTGLTENISEGGLFVATHVLREVGSRLPLEFTLPGRSAPIRATGQVRWIRIYSETSDAPPGMGLQFLDLSDEDKAAISHYVARRSPIFWDD